MSNINIRINKTTHQTTHPTSRCDACRVTKCTRLPPRFYTRCNKKAGEWSLGTRLHETATIITSSSLPLLPPPSPSPGHPHELARRLLPLPLPPPLLPSPPPPLRCPRRPGTAAACLSIESAASAHEGPEPRDDSIYNMHHDSHTHNLIGAFQNHAPSFKFSPSILIYLP